MSIDLFSGSANAMVRGIIIAEAGDETADACSPDPVHTGERHPCGFWNVSRAV